MKGLRFGSKIVFVINSLVAFLLLISYILPYIPPKSFATLSVLSLGVPLLILSNLLFFIFWLLRVKKQMILSLVVLLLGYNYISSMYKFSGASKVEDDANFSVMSFNVRMFNKFNWLPEPIDKEHIVKILADENPDILCLQEYPRGERVEIVGYDSFNAKYVKGIKGGQAIFSKFPIVNSGSLEFPNTFNNAIFADIVKEKDTIRIYTFHLQSSGINTDVENLKNETSGHLFKQVGATFKMQQDQVALFLAHKEKCHYKTIVTGDFNNTAYSYVYRKIKGDDLVDTFEEAGNGFGRTFDFKFFPMRIDFILADQDFTVNGFKTYDVKLSDHFPIKTTLKLH
ncbi:endonuclease/exonuclease/phosphatase family protein [Winogradskyella endarachnes]|uniref:Endonuclease n=1 Tax=Winogradskyella endarachnes TaxID=2681965 RepID=A0A6L6U9X8_9FLAO|nr:endonuclease/exonuclease/phosphatase family protein [Winogradskyella endarachnes]MUU77614.1 endonuclease [Winogradskyella endarachnes]